MEIHQLEFTVEDILAIHRHFIIKLFVEDHRSEEQIADILREQRLPVTASQVQRCLNEWGVGPTSSPTAKLCRRAPPGKDTRWTPGPDNSELRWDRQRQGERKRAGSLQMANKNSYLFEDLDHAINSGSGSGSGPGSVSSRKDSSSYSHTTRPEFYDTTRQLQQQKPSLRRSPQPFSISASFPSSPLPNSGLSSSSFEPALERSNAYAPYSHDTITRSSKEKFTKSHSYERWGGQGMGDGAFYRDPGPAYLNPTYTRTHGSKKTGSSLTQASVAQRGVGDDMDGGRGRGRETELVDDYLREYYGRRERRVG